jgi:RNA polymerase sigma factor (sigma-70 family)
MSKGTLDNLMHDLHRIAGLDALREHADADLLARFASQRDEAAFAALVWRHGGLVFGVCKRMLHHEQDAEDAFQAAFLTLARKADSISNKESLAAWLYRVAYRIALRARKKTPLPGHDAATLDQLPARDVGNDLEQREILQSLDEAIAQLPSTSARAIILCYFEGKTHEEAARVIGCPTGTLASWIARARLQLHDRLTRRGIKLTAAGLGTLLAEQASAAPAAWIPLTAKAVVAFVSGTGAANILSANAVVLSEGVLRMMWFNKLKMFAAIALLLVTFGIGAGVLANSVWGGVGEAPAVNGDAQAEIAKLRNEIAKLRAELNDAVKEMKSLKEGLPADGVNPKYRGKPASFWLEQLKDGDPKYREEAIISIGALARKNAKLTSAIIQSLKADTDRAVVATAAQVLAKHGIETLPALMEIAEDKQQIFHNDTRISAIQAIGSMRSKAKPAIPVLVEVLKETKDYDVASASLNALHMFRSDAVAAIPVLIEKLEYCVQDIAKQAMAEQPFSKESKGAFQGHSPEIGSMIVRTLCQIDSGIANLLALQSPTELQGMPGGGLIGVTSIADWRKTVDALKKYTAKKQ